MGIFIAILIIILWFGHLLYCLLFAETDFSSIFFYLHILIQTFLYTGLFITAHDAMHGSVSRNRKVNNFIGYLSTILFAFLSFRVLSKKHYLHHLFPASEKDPDFSMKSNNFFVWWYSFMRNYTTWWQILLMAITFNILLIWFSEIKVISFWVAPAIFSTFQLFFFGTWLPHRRPFTEEMKPHYARSLKKNHFIAMLSCYFFGYHWEHHQSPTTPWWRLYRFKE
ncbi:MAG: fatty acid desaturase [Bacteroidales bacterium]|jgi:beta-carotene ketolase (CrtW type)|nr:fatty acid desaturase [Bacteroidales bacterium]